MSEKIDSIIVHDEQNVKGFFYDYRFLSNFHLCDIVVVGLTFPSVENAYQALKCAHETDYAKLLGVTPAKAKNIGQKVQLRKDWEEIKLQVMYDLNYQKYSKHLNLHELLMATGDKYLEETNYWYDTFWGVCKGVGLNHLGVILMKIRGELCGQ